MGKIRRIGLRCLVLAGGFLLSSVGLAQYTWWCENPIPPCDPNSSQSLCYLPPLPDPRCTPGGQDECNNCTTSPCYVGSGSYETTALDLSIRTVGFPLKVSRRYDSTHAIDGPLGKGWTTGVVARLYHAVYLLAPPSTYQKEVFIQMPEGGRYRFADNGNGTFTPPLGRYDTLMQNQDGTWALTLQRTRSVFQFDATGALTSMTDAYGNQLTVAYDGNSRVQQVADASGSGRYLNVLWGPDGRVSTVQDSTGRQIQYAYNAQGALSSMTNPLGQLTTYAYFTGRFGPLLSEIRDHWNRVITNVTYDTKDRVASYTEQGETYTYAYAYGGNPTVTAKTDSVGNRWLFPFSAGGLISDATPPSGGGGPTHADYYPDGLVQQFIDGVGVKTFYTYNAQGNPLSITRDYQGPTAVRFDYTYDTTFAEKIVSMMPKNPATNQYDPNWQAWRYDYHPPGSPAPGALHRVYRVRDDGMTTDTLGTYEYDTKGRLTRQTSAIGGATDYGYDAVGNLETLTAPANNDAGSRPVTIYGYDAAERVTSLTDPLGHVTSYAYDALGRVTSVTPPKPSVGSPLDFTTAYSYDNFDAASGLVFTHVTDPNGKMTKHGYDQFGQLARVVDAMNNATSYGYTRGLLTSITDANSNVTSYGYDSVRRLTTTTFPNGAIEQYTYTGDSLLYQKTDRKNQAITFAYDRHKRLSQKSNPGSASIVHTYQGQKLTQVVDSTVIPAETHLFGYDGSYRLSSETQGSRGTIGYQYNADDSVLSYSVQSGPTSTYSYYPDGSLKAIAWSLVSGEFKYEYTATDRYQRVTFPGGQKRWYFYDDQGRLAQVSNTTAAGAPVPPLPPQEGNLATYVYGYDVNHATGAPDRKGQRVSMTATVPSQGFNGHETRFEYDNLYQLANATYPTVAPFNGEVHSWTYDAIGNRLTNTVNGGTQTYSYQKVGANPLNWQRLLTDGANSYSYDSNGSALTRNGPGGNFTFAWNADNRMTSISGAAVASYSYDHQGRRSSKTVGSATTYLYKGLDLIRETGASPADYLFGPGIDQPLAVSRAGSVSYYQADALGSISLLADAAGTVQNSYVYDVWGAMRSSTAPIANPFGYTSREFGEASTPFYRTRYYSPEVGRFLTEDPVGMMAAGQTSYGYVSGDPVKFVDPYGLWKIPPGGGSPPAPWTPDPSHHAPGGQRWTAPNGDKIDFHQGKPGRPGHAGRDHWHYLPDGVKQPDHLYPGDEIPDPVPDDAVPNDDDSNSHQQQQCWRPEPVPYRDFTPITPIPIPLQPLPLLYPLLLWLFGGAGGGMGGPVLGPVF